MRYIFYIATEQSGVISPKRFVSNSYVSQYKECRILAKGSGIMVSFIFYAFACKEIEKIVKPLGFKRYHRFFCRVTEDGVVQQFCLLCLHGDFTIRFSMDSIFGDNDRTEEGSDIYRLIDGTNGWIGRNFDRSVINGMTVYTSKKISYVEAVDMCKNVLLDVLLPCFEKTKVIKNAHTFMLENDSLVKHGTIDFDTREIGFYLSKENYDKAKEVLAYYIENKNKWNKRWWKEKEVEYLELYDAIKNNDMNYIKRYKKDKKGKNCLELGIRGI